MKTEKQIREKIEELEAKKDRNEINRKTLEDWTDALYYVLEEYCSGVDCAWCSNTECINM